MSRSIHPLSTTVIVFGISALLLGCGSPQPPRQPAPAAEAYSKFAPLEVDLTGNPDWMAAAAGSVWVKRDDGVVTRLDPGSGEIIADIDVKAVPNEDPCNGIGVSTDAIWSCSETSIVRIDPTTNEVTKTVPVGKIWAQGRLVHAAGRIWVLAGEGDRLVGITTADGAAAEPISLPAKCVDLGAASDVVYAACTDDDTVLRIDPATAAITKVAVKGPNHVSVAGSSAWVAAAEGLLRLEPTSLATQLTIPEIVPGAFGGILADDAAVWVRQENPFLIRVDATTGAQTRVITAPHGSGDVVVDGTRIWASDVEGNSLIRLTVPATS